MGENLGSLTDCYVTQENGKRALAVTGGGVPLDINLQDQFSSIVDRFLTVKLATCTLSAPTAIESRFIDLVAGHGFTGSGNEMIEISEGLIFYQSRVISLIGNQIKVTNPLPFIFTTASLVQRVSPDCNILATSESPVIFSAMPPLGIEWDINILAINMLDETAMDDATFGGMPPLTNGAVYRTKNGDIENIFTAIDNSCFIRHCDVENPYSDKAPSGFYGFNTKRRFNGQQGDGVSRRIVGDAGGQFQLVLADDFRGLNRYWNVIRGHVVVD